MPRSYTLTSWNAEGNATISANGEQLTETAAAALTALVAASGSLADAAAQNGTDSGIALSFRGEGDGPAALVVDLAYDLLGQIEQTGGMFAPVEIDGLIRTDEGLSAWGYLHQVASATPPRVGLELSGELVMEYGERDAIIGLTVQVHRLPAKDQTGS